MKTKIVCSLIIGLFLSFAHEAQITLEPHRVGINSAAPTATLEVNDTTNVTEVMIRNTNVSRLTLDASSPNIQWNVSGNRKAFANWSNNALRIYSSPPTSPPFSFQVPTLNLTEERKVGINMGLVGNPTEALDVNGRIKVGNSADTSAAAGTIRWNNVVHDFEGYDGQEWLSLTAGAQPGINPGGVGRITNVQQLGVPVPGTSNFGYDVAISGNRAVSGAVNLDGLGYVTCYEKIGETWQEVQNITPADVDTNDYFGRAVAMEGDWMAVSAYRQEIDSVDQGAVYIYQHNGSQWIQHQKLVLANPREGDLFGTSLELKGDQLFVGAIGRRNTQGLKTGAVMAYGLLAGSWGLGFTYYPVSAEAGEQYGIAIAKNDDHLVVGASGKDRLRIDGGVAYVYDRNAGLYINPQEIYTPSYIGGLTLPRFGQAVATSNGKVVVTRRTGSLEISLWEENINDDHFMRVILPYDGFFDPTDLDDRVFRDVDMEGDYLIMGLGGYDGGADCNQVMEGIGKIMIMKRNGNIWQKCDEYVDPSGTLGQGDYMSVAITPDGQFIVGLPRSGYGDKVIFGQVE